MERQPHVRRVDLRHLRLSHVHQPKKKKNRGKNTEVGTWLYSDSTGCRVKRSRQDVSDSRQNVSFGFHWSWP